MRGAFLDSPVGVEPRNTEFDVIRLPGLGRQRGVDIGAFDAVEGATVARGLDQTERIEDLDLVGVVEEHAAVGPALPAIARLQGQPELHVQTLDVPELLLCRAGALPDPACAVVQGLPVLVGPGAQVRLDALLVRQQHNRAGRRLQAFIGAPAHDLVQLEMLPVLAFDGEMCPWIPPCHR